MRPELPGVKAVGNDHEMHRSAGNKMSVLLHLFNRFGFQRVGIMLAVLRCSLKLSFRLRLHISWLLEKNDKIYLRKSLTLAKNPIFGEISYFGYVKPFVYLKKDKIRKFI